MPDVDMNARAAEIDRDLKSADAKRRADAEAASNANAEILEALQGLTVTMTAISERMDTIEAAKTTETPMTVEAASSGEPQGRARDAALASVQARADAICAVRGERAPPPMAGEKVLAYRRRLLRDLRHESKDFGKLELSDLTGPMFDAVEARIYADALAASSRPSVAPGELREIKTQDQSGRWMSTFYGEPKAWMDDFSCQRQRVVKINTNH